MRSTRFWLAVAALACLPQLGLAQDAPHPDGRADSHSGNAAPAGARESSRSGGGVLGLLPADSVTSHTLDVDGRTLSYKATAGTLNLFGADGERSAAMFYTSYIADRPTPDRPLTFVFNGGPGAASALSASRAGRSQAARLRFPPNMTAPPRS